MPMNPPAPEPSRAARIGKVAARHGELVIFCIGLITGVLMTLLAGVAR